MRSSQPDPRISNATRQAISSLQPVTTVSGRFWIITLSVAKSPEQPCLEDDPRLARLVGQKEKGEGGYIHWQFLAHFSKTVRRSHVSKVWPTCHAELSRSAAAENYVRKDDTKVEGSEFELGDGPLRRNVSRDYESIWALARAGEIEEIPADLRIRFYNTIVRIRSDFQRPIDITRRVKVFWGASGTGKTFRARQEAGLLLYVKNPNTKWWDGYRGETNVLIDEFRGRIDVSYLLLWLDNYSHTYEVKGGSKCSETVNIWLTSNLHPKDWYPGLDPDTLEALLRRVELIHFPKTPFTEQRNADTAS